MSIKNIVLFGETGAGKSSVVNLMAGQEKAETSSGAESCTLQWEEHIINFDGSEYKVFDTIGLEEYQLKPKGYLDAIANAYNLVTKLHNEGGIDLLLFCVRAGRVTTALQGNYRLFYEWLCEKKVPVVLILTGLEREEKGMEDWWSRNESTLQKYGIHVAGHACITAVKGPDGRYQKLYEESYGLVRDLVTQHTHGVKNVAWKEDLKEWFSRFMLTLRKFLLGNGTPKGGDTVTVLTKRCGMPLEVAVELNKLVTN